jgi:hypothetical protein
MCLVRVRRSVNIKSACVLYLYADDEESGSEKEHNDDEEGEKKGIVHSKKQMTSMHTDELSDDEEFHGVLLVCV